MSQLTKGGVSVALASLSEAWPNLAPKCKAKIIQSTVFDIARDMRATDRDLQKAVSDIVRTGGMLTTATGIPDLISTALANGETTARPQIYNCKERFCYKGLLQLQLSDGYTTTVACPYCDAGQRRQAAVNTGEIDKNRALDNDYYRRKNKLVKAALKEYDTERQQRIRKKEGFKYE